jgi:valacyclovir hydrolase
VKSSTINSTIDLHFEDLGRGEQILFIPGALGTGSGDFPYQLQFFSQKYRVIAPDLRGYGRSRPPERDYPVDFYHRDVEDLYLLTERLGLNALRVMGWSDGGNVGALMAAKYPAKVKQLVMWGGNSFVSDEEIATFRSMRSLDSWSPRALETLKPIYGASLTEIWGRYVDCMGEIHANGGDLYKDYLPRISCPTLILHGEKDPLVPAFHPSVLQAAIEGSSVHRFPEGKHNIHAKYAEEFNRIVSDFFEGRRD